MNIERFINDYYYEMPDEDAYDINIYIENYDPYTKIFSELVTKVKNKVDNIDHIKDEFLVNSVIDIFNSAVKNAAVDADELKNDFLECTTPLGCGPHSERTFAEAFITTIRESFHTPCKKVLIELITKVKNEFDNIDRFDDEFLVKWVINTFDSAVKNAAINATELKNLFLVRVTPPGCITYSERTFAEDLIAKIKEYNEYGEEEEEENADMETDLLCPRESVFFKNADLFEVAWRIITSASYHENMSEDEFYPNDSGNIFLETDKVMIPADITVDRLVGILRVLNQIKEKDVPIDEDSLSECIYCDLFGNVGPMSMVYYHGEAIFEYCLRELLSENNEAEHTKLNIRKIFEDKENILIPYRNSMTDERLRNIYNVLTLYSDEEFANNLSVDQYKRVTISEFIELEPTCIPFSELEALISWKEVASSDSTTGLRYGGKLCPRQSVFFKNANLFEVAWRIITSVSCYENMKVDKLDMVDVGNIFLETDKVMIHKYISVGRLAEILRVINHIQERDIPIDEDSLSECLDYEVLGNAGPMSTVFYHGEDIFEYCLWKLLSENNEGRQIKLDIRKIFEDKESLLVPFNSSIDDERLRNIYNVLTLWSDVEFANSLSVDQYRRETISDFIVFKPDYIPFSEIESLVGEYPHI